MLKMLRNNKLRILNFGYVIAVNVTIMYINIQMNLHVSLKVIVKLA